MQVVSIKVEPDKLTTYVDSAIVIEFDQPVDPNTVSATSVLLYRQPQYNMYAFDKVVDGVKLTLTPKVNNPWVPNTKFTLVLNSGANGILSTTASPLAGREMYDFNTGQLFRPSTPVVTDPALSELNLTEADKVFTKDNKQILIPDDAPQGDIQPFSPCYPDFGQQSPTGAVVTEGSGIGYVLPTGLIRLASIPAEFEVGVEDVSQITLIWSRTVQLQNQYPVQLSWQDQPMAMNPFLKNPVTATFPSNSNGPRSFHYFDPIDTMNREFTVKIPAGGIAATDEIGTVFNGGETFVFSGPLNPLFCTVDAALTRAGMWDVELTRKAEYYYFKMIHQESVYAMKTKGYTDVTTITPEDLDIMSRYVCCTVALRALAFGNGDVDLAQTGGMISRVKSRTLPGVAITYDLISGQGKKETPMESEIQKLRDCITNTGILGDNDYEPIMVATAVKSSNDRRFPAMRRL